MWILYNAMLFVRPSQTAQRTKQEVSTIRRDLIPAVVAPDVGLVPPPVGMTPIPLTVAVFPGQDSVAVAT